MTRISGADGAGLTSAASRLTASHTSRKAAGGRPRISSITRSAIAVMALEYLQSRHPANLNSPTEEAAACHRADLVSPGLFRSVTRQVFHQQRQSRNRITKADRKIEDRKMKRHPIFLSSIFLSLCLSAAPLPHTSSQPAKNLDYCSAKVQRRKAFGC